MDSVSVWDEGAALQSCWLDCEAYPTSAYRSGKTPGFDPAKSVASITNAQTLV